MKKSIHPETKLVEAKCASCKHEFSILTTENSIKIEVCSNCHPFYTGQQTIIDTANKVKDFERRRSAAQPKSNISKSQKRSKNKTTEIKGEKLLTLRDMLKSIQG